MHGPNLWPDAALVPGWQQHVRTYFSAMLDLSRVVARGLALSLGLPEHFFDDKMKDPVAQLLLLRYPPPPAAARAAAAISANGHNRGAASLQRDQDGITCAATNKHQQQQQQEQQRYVGCGSHTDCGFLTILAQVRIFSLPWA